MPSFWAKKQIPVLFYDRLIVLCSFCFRSLFVFMFVLFHLCLFRANVCFSFPLTIPKFLPFFHSLPPRFLSVFFRLFSCFMFIPYNSYTNGPKAPDILPLGHGIGPGYFSVYFYVCFIGYTFVRKFNFRKHPIKNLRSGEPASEIFGLFHNVQLQRHGGIGLRRFVALEPYVQRQR